MVEVGLRGVRVRLLGQARAAYLADERVRSASPLVLGRRLMVRYRPLGVVGVIGPWNYPLVNSFGDCIPALAAGNAVVLKPSELTPLTSLLMGEGLRECGLPEDVLPGRDRRRRHRRALVDAGRHGHVHGLDRDGHEGHGARPRALTPVSLELGGKDPMIVLADADVERAARAAVTTRCRTAARPASRWSASTSRRRLRRLRGPGRARRCARCARASPAARAASTSGR